VNKELVQSIQQTIQQVEVLDVERLPGRLMMAGKPLCRLKLGSSKILFEVGAKLQGLDESQTESPNVYVSDIGLDHYKGVISGLVAEEFCQTIQKLCKEAQAACAG